MLLWVIIPKHYCISLFTEAIPSNLGVSLDHIMGFFLQISLNELNTMMSDQDSELLAQLTPALMKSVTIDESDLLAQLRARGALTDQQKHWIEVIKQYYICHLLGPFFV